MCTIIDFSLKYLTVKRRHLIPVDGSMLLLYEITVTKTLDWFGTSYLICYVYCNFPSNILTATWYLQQTWPLRFSRTMVHANYLLLLKYNIVKFLVKKWWKLSDVLNNVINKWKIKRYLKDNFWCFGIVLQTQIEWTHIWCHCRFHWCTSIGGYGSMVLQIHPGNWTLLFLNLWSYIDFLFGRLVLWKLNR